MKNLLAILSLVILISFVSVGLCKAQDSANVDLGKNWKFSVGYLPFAVIVEGSEEPNTILEAKPYLGTGGSFMFVWKEIIGVHFSSLFYTDKESEKVYPMFGSGFIVFPHHNVSISLFYDMGKEEREFKKEWQARLKLILSYNVAIF